MAIAIIEIQAGKFDPNGKPIIQNCYIADLHIVMIDPDTGDIQTGALHAKPDDGRAAARVCIQVPAHAVRPNRPTGTRVFGRL
jgi:hypothetical protein